MLVPGDIAATSAAIRMKNPADAACAPPGVTYTTTGTLLAMIAVVISRVVSTSPPGVLSSITSRAAFLLLASASPRSM